MSQAYPLIPAVQFVIDLAFIIFQIFLFIVFIYVVIIVSAKLHDWIDEKLNNSKNDSKPDAAKEAK